MKNLKFLRESYVLNDLNRHFSKYFQEFKLDNNEKFIAIGSCSTVTSLCCVFLKLSYYNQKKIEGFEMSLEDVKKTIFISLIIIMMIN